eukprot:TRINITY_DN2148_c0_g2_i3.p1 TRINITY_DN2148_c0_g2~~TRINITY_DN2148_c0_g2_i3.p1  ORF type:complete len:142 (-),score=40.66 TRINITY_DN2148_c0_g2_i3:157-582(-)
MKLLQIWLLFVSALSLFGAFQAFFLETLKDQQFSNAPEQVTDVARRLFGSWTILATVILALCAFHLHEKAIVNATLGSFIIVFIVYSYETFIAKTIPLWPNATAPFIIAGISFFWIIIDKYGSPTNERRQLTQKKEKKHFY